MRTPDGPGTTAEGRQRKLKAGERQEGQRRPMARLRVTLKAEEEAERLKGSPDVPEAPDPHHQVPETPGPSQQSIQGGVRVDPA